MDNVVRRGTGRMSDGSGQTAGKGGRKDLEKEDDDAGR